MSGANSLISPPQMSSAPRPRTGGFLPYGGPSPRRLPIGALANLTIPTGHGEADKKSGTTVCDLFFRYLLDIGRMGEEAFHGGKKPGGVLICRGASQGLIYECEMGT